MLRKVTLVMIVAVAVTGCVGGGPPSDANYSEGEFPTQSRTTQTDTAVTENENGSITFELTNLDEETSSVKVKVVTGRGSEEIYEFDGVGDTYTVEEPGRYSVVAEQNGKTILLENKLITE